MNAADRVDASAAERPSMRHVSPEYSSGSYHSAPSRHDQPPHAIAIVTLTDITLIQRAIHTPVALEP